VKTAALTAREFPSFVVNELRGHKVRIDADAAAFLVQAVGQDLRSLSAAASQLAGDFEGKPITIDMVKTYFGGRAEAKSFAVADHAIFGRAAKALEELRGALDGGTAPVLVTSAVAGSLRGLAKFKAAPRGMRNADLMREVGVPSWKLDMLRDQARGWDEAGIARAIRVVAAADADIKGKAHDASYSLEKMVLDIVRARPQRS
jgi:DNA polymerase-3 subunit delta